MIKVVTIIILLTSFFNAVAQTKNFEIYVGKVEGVSKGTFIQQQDFLSLMLDSTLKMRTITESIYPVEIRLYEKPSAMAVETCTILFFDSSFQVKRFSRVFDGWEKKNYERAHFPLEKIKADSAFSVVIENGIFTLQVNDEIDSVRRVLTDSGFTKINILCGVSDGSNYLIQFKVNNLFRNIRYSDMEGTQLRCYPDNQMIRRKTNIVAVLKASMQLVKK